MKTILECVVGSTLHGTSVQDGLEDLDLMAVVLEDAPRMIGFSVEDVRVTRTKPQGVRSEAGDTDHVAYGLRKFLNLALKGNPTILLPLFAGPEHIRVMTPVGEQLQGLAPFIVSKKCFEPFMGYMHQQHKRMLGTIGQKNCTRPELVERYAFDTKDAGHIIRLGLQGKELMRTGRLELPMEPSARELVVAVRTGKYKLEQVSQMVEVLTAQMGREYDESPLRDEPRFAHVEDWMVKTYLEHWA